MAMEMQIKFAKYWKDYSLILAIGAVLDPRLKVKMLEVAYQKVDPTTSALKIKELEKNLEMIFKAYQTSSPGVSGTTNPHDLLSESPLEDDFDNDLFELERSIEAGVNNTKSHLDIYLAEPRLEWKAFPNLDVLRYWKDNQHRLGDLALMALDILSIPITTVSSESAFSIGSRVLTPYRNRLLPQNVRALLCTRNWLRGFAEYEGTVEDNNDTTL
ncbi:hAT-like transposase RNase-H fold [Arabidopsis suecica]|uniref:HAT-like transposase RNase-H fold n=2 Tax=Arabidopsis TaxID=3701 RepID=A0A8T2B9C5_ARASU|nr:hAT-like transposase RNase-H fold [Arabidopsis suecica]